MKTSILKRIEAIEQKQQLPGKFLILMDGEPLPENPDETLKIIQIRIVDHSDYLEPNTPRLPFCPC